MTCNVPLSTVNAFRSMTRSPHSRLSAIPASHTWVVVTTPPGTLNVGTMENK